MTQINPRRIRDKPAGADEECLLPPGFLPPVKGQVASLQMGVDSPHLLPYNIGEGTDQCCGS